MKFINTNTNKKFREVAIGNSTLYVHGYINYTDNDLFTKLDKGIVPIDLKGQFGIIFISNDFWLGIADHLCTTQLFYSKDHISPNLKDVKDNTKFLHKDSLCESQLDILRIHTVGDVTPWKEIKRIDFQHYVKNGTQYEYANILHEPTTLYNKEYAYDTYMQAIKNMDIKDPTLLFSSGRDSAFMAMLLKEAGFNPRLINITSKNANQVADRIGTERYRQELGWVIDDYDIEYSGPTTEDDAELFCSNYWHDTTHPPKRHACEMYNGTKLTGEVTIASHIKKNYGNYFINASNRIKIEDVINLYITYTHSLQTSKEPRVLSKDRLGSKAKSEGYDYIFEYYRNIINNIDKPKLYSHCIWVNRSFCSQRIYAQSQDPSNEWGNVFSDYDVFNMNSNIDYTTDTSKDRIKKYPLYQVAKMFKSWTDISWDSPIVGLGIPSKNKFRNV